MAYSMDFTHRHLNRKGNQNKAKQIDRKTLLGQSIDENSVPLQTADSDGCPFVVLQDPNSKKSFGVTKGMLSYGFLTVGPPGTGKTNLFNFFIDRLLTTMEKSDVIVIFDPKGDYYDTFGKRLSEREKIVIGNGESYRTITGYHNIFSEIMPRGIDGRLVYTYESDEDALDICEQLFRPIASETQPIFSAMAEQVVSAVMIYLMRKYWCSDQSKLNNKELIRFFSNSTNKDLKDIFEEDFMSDQRSCVDYISIMGNQTQGVNSYIGSMLRKMFVGPFAEANPSREFSMREAINGEKKVIFIEYDLRKGNLLSPMYGILLDRAMVNALGGRNSKRSNVYFLLDEMLLLPKLNHLPDLLNFGRSQGCKVMGGLQNISGLEDLYGEAGARNILSSFQNIVAFRMNDYYTRNYIIDRLGNNYQNYSFSSHQATINIQREGHTVEDWDILTLKTGEAIVSLIGESPFLFTLPLFH